MTNNQADTLERIERFGISRTAWRLIVMAAFAMLAFLGAFLSLTKGSADISLAQIIIIQPNIRTAKPDYLEYQDATDNSWGVGGCKPCHCRCRIAGGNAKSSG